MYLFQKKQDSYFFMNLLGPSPDCDSGYDASTMESASTPFNVTSPNTDTCDTTGDTHESLSEVVDPDAEDDNVSTVSNISDLSGLSDLSGQEWKAIAGSMQWVIQNFPLTGELFNNEIIIFLKLFFFYFKQ